MRKDKLIDIMKSNTFQLVFQNSLIKHDKRHFKVKLD